MAETKTAPAKKTYHLGTGRRKTSIARVRLCDGTGKIQINGRTLEDYFTEDKDRSAVTGPCTAEYGPSARGMKKIDRTQTIATTTISDAQGRELSKVGPPPAIHIIQMATSVMRLPGFGRSWKTLSTLNLRS